MELMFGIGALWGNRTDVTGSGIGPDEFAILQDNTIEVDFEAKQLYGQFQFPMDIARGKGKITGKAKMARVFGALYGDLFFGVTPTAGQTAIAENEAGTVPAVSTYTVTVANAATFNDDLGVYNTTTGARFTRVTTPASAGQYSVNTGTGVYTFSAADANAKVSISYAYTVAGSGKTVAINNQFMGATPTFKASFTQQRTTVGAAGQLNMFLYQCVSSKLSFPSRLDDYNIPEFDFEAFANAAGQVGLLSTTE